MSSSEKRYHILSEAEKLFARKGFNGTSIRDIAEDANVNISMISYYFGSKEGLMQALFQERTGHILPEMEKLIKNQGLTSFQKVEFLIDEYVEKALQKLLFNKILIGEQMMDKDPVIKNLIYELKKKHAELLQILVSEGQERGAFKKDIDIVLMMNTMSGIVTQTLITQDYYKQFNGLENYPEEEFSLLLKNKLSSYIKDLFKSLLIYEA